MELNQNTDGAARFLPMTASAPAKDNPLDYKPKYVTHQAHPIL